MSTLEEGDTASSSLDSVSRRLCGREGTLQCGASSLQQYVCCKKREKTREPKGEDEGRWLNTMKAVLSRVLAFSYSVHIMHVCLIVKFYPRYWFCPCRMNEHHHPLPLWLPTWSACTENRFRRLKLVSIGWRRHFGPHVGHGVLIWHRAKWHNVGPEYSKKHWVCPSTRGPSPHAQYGALKTVLVKWANSVITRLHTAPQETFFPIG